MLPISLNEMENKLLSLFGQYLELGEKGKIQSFESCLSQLGMDFGCTRYTCVRDKMYKNPHLAVGFEEEVKNIASKIGFSMGKEKVYHIPIVGYTYSGKTMFAKLVEFLSEKKGLKARYVNARDFLIEENETTVYEDILGYANSYDIIIIDDAWLLDNGVGAIKKIGEEMEKGSLITVWKYLNYVTVENKIYEEIGNTLGEVVIKDMDINMADMVFDSLWSIIGRGKAVKLKNYFRRIFDESSGSPGLSVRIFLDFVRSYCQEQREEDMKDYFEYYLNNMFLPVRKIKDEDLDAVKIGILNAILTDKDERGAMPSVISSKVKKDNATVTYHLNKLKSMGILRDMRFGKNIFYRVIDIYAPFFERLIMNRMKEVVTHGDRVLQPV